MPAVATTEDQEQATQEQAYAAELAQAMAQEQADQRIHAEQERLARAQAMMQQIAAAQEGEGGFSDRQYRQMAKQMMKQYKIKMESLKKDLKMEWRAFGSPFYFPISTTLLSIVEALNIIDLTGIGILIMWIVNLIIFICMPIIRVYRAWQKANIMYASAERRVKRQAIILERQIWNTIKRTLASVVEAVPLLNIIPVWPALNWLDKFNERKHQKKLNTLEERVRRSEQRVNRLTVRARSGQAQYRIALVAMQTARSLDDEFLNA